MKFNRKQGVQSRGASSEFRKTTSSSRRQRGLSIQTANMFALEQLEYSFTTYRDLHYAVQPMALIF